MEVDEKGLRETDLEIESFVPWTAMTSFVLWREIAFIKLRTGQWAIVPRRSLSAASPSLEELVAVLRERNIPEAAAPAF